jgi:GPH family glycoside/pentoside/hexuronide:cation symporter
LKKINQVSHIEKIAVGVGTIPGTLGWGLVRTLTVSVYQMTLGVSPALLGIALAVPSVWDAFVDPVMGRISDNFHSRWGRRRPFIVVGAILMGVTFGLIWMVPEGWGEMGKILYLIITLIAFYTCFSVYMVPLQSLMLEMTPDYDERTRVMAYGSFFNKAMEFGQQWIFPLSQLAIFGSAMAGVRTIGWIVSILLFVAVGCLPGIFSQERYYKKAARQDKVKFFDSVKGAFGNRGFAILAGLTVLMVFGGMFTSTLTYYLVVYHLFDGNVAVGSVWQGILASTYGAVGILSLWPVTWLSAKFGKQSALMIVFVMAAIGGLLKWILYVPGTPWLICLDPILCAPIWTALGVLTPSLLADICDDDELRHNQRREGMFSALFGWVNKACISLAFLLTGLILQFIGFDAKLGGAQPGNAIFIMRMIFVLSTTVTAVLAVILLPFYPIGRKRAAEIRALLEERRGAI